MLEESSPRTSTKWQPTDMHARSFDKDEALTSQELEHRESV